MVVVSQLPKRSLAGVVEQGRHLVDFLSGLRPAQFLRPVPGRADQVLDVTARMVVEQTALLTSLNQPTTQRPASLPDFFDGRGVTRHRHDRVREELAAHEQGPELATQFRQGFEEVILRLNDPHTPAVVSADGGAIRTVDLLRLVGADWVMHSDDLCRALPGHRPVVLSPDALADAVRVYADVLRRRHPGRSIEVRIPPVAAVQCGTPGEPKHTRGTPPTVVETTSLPFLRLCRGRESWEHATRLGHVVASGVRADISEWLPLY